MKMKLRTAVVGELIEVKIISYYGRIIYKDKANINNKKQIRNIVETLKRKYNIDLSKTITEYDWWD